MANRHSNKHRSNVVDVVDGLRRIVHALHHSHRLAEQRWELSAAQLLVLQRLAEAPTLSVNELADRTFTHQSTVSVVVARLVDRGLVRRSRADDDARRAELALTSSGRALLRRAMSSAQAQLFDALDAMPPERLRLIADGVQGVVDALGVATEPAGMFFEDDVAEDAGNGSVAAKRRHAR
ncbi:MAG TPA: MarR family transcriptional regulator [Gemmatimonadaceae bacterium]|jgi:DNA-binding MarR family transcriptional regulator